MKPLENAEETKEESKTQKEQLNNSNTITLEYTPVIPVESIVVTSEMIDRKFRKNE